jgi:hypothetical protein
MISKLLLFSTLEEGSYAQKSPVGIVRKFFLDFRVDFVSA